MSRKWLLIGLASLALTAALADTCLPVKHSHRTVTRWAKWRTGHPSWHAKKAPAPVVCTPATPPALPPPSLQPFPVDDDEQQLVDHIENQPPATPPAAPLYAEYVYVDYDWMIPPDIGVPNQGHRHHWPRGWHPWRPHRRYSVPEGPTVFLMLTGLAMIAGVLGWRRV